ncbi:MAG: ABC transporter permease subunit [Puniceicoccales bacterium]|jgi:sulfate transport system permease protein|nr:ABC transporter permease subunit [Puniceicoccales bacterium]
MQFITDTSSKDPPWLRRVLTGVALLFLGAFILLPLASVFTAALEKGVAVYTASFTEADALAALKLTLLVAAITVPANVVFGIAAAWAITKFDFKGKSLLVTLIDLPFAVSPVIAGLSFVLVFGLHGWLTPEMQTELLAPLAKIARSGADAGAVGEWFLDGIANWLEDPKIIFATPGIVLATIFVTFPFVARELIPLMNQQGRDEELAALTLGASGWQVFRRVTLPNIKWGLFYGIILANARAMGEFGAVSVVSGHIRGETNTLPLHVEILYNEYQSTAAFACASLLALLAIVTLVLKSIVEWHFNNVKRAAALNTKQKFQ